MKKDERDKARFWIDLEIEGKQEKILIEYYALRSDDGDYLGCAEVSSTITDIQQLKGEKRLLD
jgi:hypothetical protein